MNIRGYILRFISVICLSAAYADVMAGEEFAYKKLVVSYSDAVAVVKFNNPPRYTMDQTVVEELDHFLSAVQKDDETRVVILTGVTDKIFISHYDVGEIGTKSKTRQVSDNQLHAMHRALLKIENLPKPVIAVINGRAHGGGYETALACDFRFLSSNGTVGLPEVGIGIIPGGGGTQRLSRLIGPGRAKELIMLGKIVDAETALQLGMVNHVGETDKLMDDALEFAKKLAARSPVALAAVKQVIGAGAHLPIEKALLLEQKAYYATTRSVDWSKK